jgi:hypothetical protein
VRSWDVRDWMKSHGFKADAFPGMHLRDEVVERLRMYGLELTPKPLTHTAWEYYNMSYDRHADRRERDARRAAEKAVEEEVVEDAPDEEKPRGLFGFRKKPVVAPEQTYEVEDVAEEVAAPEPAPNRRPSMRLPSPNQPPPIQCPKRPTRSPSRTTERLASRADSPSAEHDHSRGDCAWSVPL